MNPLCVRGQDWLRLSHARRRFLLKKAFAYWREAGFPYYDLSRAEVAREFARLTRQDTRQVFRPGGLLGSVIGLRLANRFQPQMWSVRVSRYRSPMDVFEDDELLTAALERAWTVWPDRFGANASCLRRMLKTFPGTACVSNFRPTLARAVIDRYSSRGDTLLDFAAGYGGRLVGSLTLARHYIGIEPSPRQVSGLRRMIEWLEKSRPPESAATILQGCAEDVLPSIPTRSISLVFSSPPYHDWERYGRDATQSYVRYEAYADWLDGFLWPVITHSHRVLRRGGLLIMNVSGGRRRPSVENVVDMARDGGFRLSARKPMLLARVPYLHPRRGGPYKPEALLIFAKR